MFIVAAIACMMLGSLYQYSWALFVLPINEEFRWGFPAIQLTFTIYTWVATWVQPLAGLVADRYGPRRLNMIAGVVAGIGWIASAFADSPLMLYFSYGLGSLGVGVFYATSVNTAIKWFPDRRGLATGLVTFGFGSGAAVFNLVISNLIQTSGYRTAFLNMGIVMVIVLSAGALILNYPHADWKPTNWAVPKLSNTKFKETRHQFSTVEMVKTWQWWVLYVSFVFVSSLGLMISAQMTTMGRALNIPVGLITLALVTFPLANGSGRIIGGAVSDKIGRESTMTIYFVAFGTLSFFMVVFAGNPILFVVLVTLIGLMWGPIFTFYPAVIGDYYGRKNSTTNYGLTYTAKAWGGLLAGYVASLLVLVFGGYSMPIVVSGVISLVSAALIFPRFMKAPKNRI